MKLSDIGERNLVELARMTFRRGPHVRVGIGDDAAAIDIDGMCLVATTDMLVASVHFPPGTKPAHIGRKAVVVNLSDLAAMGAKPIGLVFSVALPRETDVNFAKRLMQGMDDAARDYISGRVKEGASREAIVQELVQRGYDPTTARDMVGGVMRKQTSPRQSGLIYLIVGLIITAISLALTIASYSAAAEQGGYYYVCCGLTLFGLALTIRGVRQLVSGRKVK